MTILKKHCKHCVCFTNHEAYLDWYRKYRKEHLERMHEISRKYRNKKGTKQYVWDRKNKKKVKCHKKVEVALKNGTLKRKPCVKCKDHNSIAHHEDYSKPLKVTWLCKVHHSLRHKELKNKRTPQ